MKKHQHNLLVKLVIRCFLVTLAWMSVTSSVTAQTSDPLSFDDFLFDIRSYVDKEVNIFAPVSGVDLVERTVTADYEYLDVNIEALEKDEIKHIDFLCGDDGGFCQLKVSGTLVNNPSYVPEYILNAKSVNVLFSVGVAVSENGYVMIHISEEHAIQAINEHTGGNEAVISGQMFTEGSGYFAVSYAQGLDEFFAGWDFHREYETAVAQALKNCEGNDKSGIKNLLAECSDPEVFEVPWW